MVIGENENAQAPSKVGAPAAETPQPASGAGPRHRGALRTMGLGLITGAADDDCSAIGTYASAGASVGPAFLWTAPVLFPMMFAVVYLSAKLGQVSGRGLFHAIRDFYPRWVLYPTLDTLIRNTFRWLALALLAYVGAALFAKPELGPVLAGTFIPTIQFNAQFLALLVAVIGTTLSA